MPCEIVHFDLKRKDNTSFNLLVCYIDSSHLPADKRGIYVSKYMNDMEHIKLPNTEWIVISEEEGTASRGLMNALFRNLPYEKFQSPEFIALLTTLMES